MTRGVRATRLVAMAAVLAASHGCAMPPSACASSEDCPVNTECTRGECVPAAPASGMSSSSSSGSSSLACNVSGGHVFCSDFVAEWPGQAGVCPPTECGSSGCQPAEQGVRAADIRQRPTLVRAGGRALGDPGSTCLHAGTDVFCLGAINRFLPAPQDEAFTVPCANFGGGGGGRNLLTVGTEHACHGVSQGTVCWGRNTEGEVSRQLVGEVLLPHAVTAVPHIHGVAGRAVTCWLAGIPAESLATCKGSGPIVEHAPTGAAAVELALGSEHACMRAPDGSVTCWGNNAGGQLGAMDTAQLEAVRVPLTGPALAVAAGERHSCAVLDSSEVSCWGDNSHGQLGGTTGPGTAVPTLVMDNGDVPVLAAAITAGARHTCVITPGMDGVLCWGDHGGPGAPSGTPTAIQGIPAGSTVLGISAGASHTCVVVQAAGDPARTTARCWGSNADGQLGVGLPSSAEAVLTW